MFIRSLVALASLAAAGSAHAAVVASFNFEGLPVIAPGVLVSDAPGGAVVTGAQSLPGFGNFFLRNSSNPPPGAYTNVILSNLPSHNQVTIDLDIAFLDSWDGRDGSAAPDNLELLVDGVVIATLTSNQQTGSFADYAGGLFVAQGRFFADGSDYEDVVIDMTGAPLFTFAHTASTLQVGLRAAGAGFQYGADESFGIDNLVFSIDTVDVPAPAGVLLFGLGLIGLAARRRA